MVTEGMAFWNTKRLDEMSPAEWESLCDGCGRCCLHKLEDIDTGLVFYTNVACHLLERQSCQCKDYENRRERVRDCLVITVADTQRHNWLPRSCAYRILAEGRSLDWWHPLVSGTPDSVLKAGISVAGRTVSEESIPADDLEDYIINWIDF
jgi:uncharacterized cysteine cluster protein YcgN (CxxCxxCC family)